VRVGALADARQNPTEIGRRVDRGEVLAVTTRTDVAEWCTQQLRWALGRQGFALEAEKPTILVSGEVTRLEVVEEGMYHGHAALKLKVSAPDGRVLWEGTATGKSTRFGRTYSAENYVDAAGGALESAVGELLDDEGFAAAPGK